VDLSVDPTIRAQYNVSRELLWIIHEGPDIALADPAIDYREEDKREELKVPRQHLTFAQLQRLVDVFTVTDEDGTRRPLNSLSWKTGGATRRSPLYWNGSASCLHLLRQPQHRSFGAY
jgi:hypothetical protein